MMHPGTKDCNSDLDLITKFLLSVKYKSFNFVNLEIVVGTVPVKLLLCKSKYSNLLNSPIQSGSCPVTY